MYELYMGREADEYSKHQDKVNNWYAMLDYYTNDYNNKYANSWNEYVQGYNTAWDEYSTDRAEEFSKWQTEQSQNFTASENDKDRAANEKASAKSDLINLITATGYEPTQAELDAAGMTKAQAEGYKKSYTSSVSSSSGSGSGDKHTYRELNLDAVRKEFERAEDVDAINVLVELYKAEGYNPDTLKILAQNAAKRFDGGGIDMDAWREEQARRRAEAAANGGMTGAGGPKVSIPTEHIRLTM